MVRNRNGWELESYNTIEDALDCINEYEKIDTYECAFEEDFYEIYDTEKEKIVWP